MSVLICHASRDERGKYSGGIAGDQDGKEVCVRLWYNRPWTHIIRCKNPDMRLKIAEAMKKAAENNYIGYSQSQRNTLLTLARKVGYDPSKVKKDCCVDCSSLVTVACVYAGIPETCLYKNGNSATTRNLRARLMSTGQFETLTDKKYIANPNALMIGDILICENHHVAVVVSANLSTDNVKTINDVVKEVIEGKWSTGDMRKKNLTQAGYDCEEVQKEVNRILKSQSSDCS